ncbi:MAG: TIR domain-containing protein [Phycisphaerae bacterium]|nr:TIR domain-containing protein [Phycisphaerae bacterium]
MAKRQVFYSFHFDNDCWRTNQVRNIGAIEGNKPVSANNWEQVKRKGDQAIKNWINSQLQGRSCTVVLAGSQTASRPWVKYEIEKSWELGKGVVGICIHKLKDSYGRISSKGNNPFSSCDFGDKKFDQIVKLYNPSGSDSTQVYAWIENNISAAIEQAIQIRNQYN